jgi:hypothetical protein
MKTCIDCPSFVQDPRVESRGACAKLKIYTYASNKICNIFDKSVKPEVIEADISTILRALSAKPRKYKPYKSKAKPKTTPPKQPVQLEVDVINRKNANEISTIAATFKKARQRELDARRES